MTTIRAIDYNGHIPQPAAMTETQLMEQIRAYCTDLGLAAFHCHDSRRSWGPGFPDLVIAGPRGYLFREVKDERKSPTADQRKWSDMLQAGGADCGVWRPRHLYSGQILFELQQLTARWQA